VTTSFAPDVNTPLPAVLESHGFATTRYLYGLDLLAERSGTEWLYYHADGLGSTRSLTDGLGDVAGAYLYAPFGNQLYANGPAVDFRFTGEQADDPTGLYFLRARYYDPTTGRFTQRDPSMGMLAMPQTLNPYSYGINNPVKYVDPTGYWVETVLDIAFIGYDLIQINQEGWTLVNTVAFVADVACALVPIGTGGGPAVRVAMAGGDVSEYLADSRDVT